MTKKAIIAIVVVFLLGAAAWKGGAFVWQTLRAMHGGH